MKTVEREEAYLRAKKRVENLKGFYWNLGTYLIVIPLLAYVNYKTTWEDIKWFWFPLLGWGLGIIFHGFSVFGAHKLFDKNWEDRKIQEFMDRERAMTFKNKEGDSDHN
ncbi:2TM domain-containing protein [Zhouia amylolytica]|uniref:2TM domain-containing protein n=1 Tax=Zhouia amylolytica TaxID=376730 RepID=A0A1I6QEZ1_9FLAO|nr:2TM domain-containing protein [Zhouia amylolytica]SFS50972.1 2TM domain-containing protein [Zhouia amylolytica]